MLSNVLRSAWAVEVNIAIMRTFVRLRRPMDSNHDLESRIEAKEQKCDGQFSTVLAAIHQMIAENDGPKRHRAGRSGFTKTDDYTPASSNPQK